MGRRREERKEPAVRLQIEKQGQVVIKTIIFIIFLSMGNIS